MPNNAIPTANTIQAVISIGSNVDNASAILDDVTKLLGKNIIRCSPQYRDPQDNDITKPYINIVALITTTLGYDDLNNKFKHIEQDYGRDHRDKINIPLDIDIVIYDQLITRPKDFKRSYFQHGYRLIEKPQPMESVL